MNIRQLANMNTQRVNPNQTITWKQSTGYVTDAAGRRVPTYTSTPIDAQVQPLSTSDLKHVDGLNMQGIMRSVILYGNVAGISRADQQGGDLLVFPEMPNATNRNWLVTKVMEQWPEWCRVIVTMQA